MAIKLKFELTQQEIDEAWAIAASRSANRFWSHMLLVALGIFALHMVLFKGEGGGALIFSLGLFLLVMLGLAHWNVRQRLKKWRKETGAYEYIFSKEEILFRGEKIEAKMKWAYYAKMIETKPIFQTFPRRLR